LPLLKFQPSYYTLTHTVTPSVLYTETTAVYFMYHTGHIDGVQKLQGFRA